MNKSLDLKRNVIWLSLIAVLAVVFWTPLAATAQGNCDRIVVDDAGVFGNRSDSVENAANELITAGADVKVRTSQSYGSAGNLDRYESQLEQQCPSWTDASGNRKNNLVVILVSVQERQTGIYFGSQWEKALGDRWTQIQTEIMNPRFAEGDFAGGVVAGLQEIDRLIRAQLNGQTQTPGKGASSAGWIVLGIVLGLIFIFAILGGIVLFRNYRKSRERRLALRQKALLAKQAAASRVNQMVDQTQMLEIKVNAISSSVSLEDATGLLEGFNKSRRLVDQGAQKYSELGHSAGNPENPKLGDSQLEVIIQEYQKVLDILSQASEEVTRAETTLATFQEIIDGFSDKASGIENTFQVARDKVVTARSSGFKTDHSDGILDKARAELEQARSLYQNRKYVQAAKSLDESTNLAQKAAQYADGLPEMKHATELAIQKLAERIDKVKESIIKGRNVFNRISNTYAESSWESIQGNGTESENRIDWTIEALDNARSAASMEKQEWPESMEFVKQGNSWLDEAESLIRAINVMDESLEAARRDAAGEIAAAQADITSAWNYINAYDEDIRESLEDDLRSAQRKLNTANENLHAEKPDYLNVVLLARETNETADKILAQARTEHESAERMRSKATAAMRDARSSVSTAREYIHNHQNEAGNEARNQLASAEATLGQAELTSELDSRISLAEKAENSANQAYSSARRRVEEAWQRRGPIIPPVIIFPGGSNRGGSPSWGSRRDSPWGFGGGGGRSGGGGGSTSWGGGRGGGGGSTRW